jgi:hypothetical protein
MKAMRYCLIPLGIALIAAVGCVRSEKTTGPDPSAVRGLLEIYIEAAETAEATKTHATGEHPAAQAEMRRIESSLRTRCATEAGRKVVRAEIDARIFRLRGEAEGIEGRMNSLRVVGRGLTPEEQDWLERGAPAQIKALEFRIRELEILKKKLGL